MLTSSETLREHPALQARPALFWLALVAGLLLVAALIVPSFFGLVYTRDDLGAFHLPTRAFYAEQLARGEPFDWMPSLFSGFYLTGEGQAGTYHPLHLFLYRVLPLSVAWGLELVISYPFMLAGAYLFLRRWINRRGAAMFGSLVFTFCGFNLLHFVHPNAVAVIAHIPWQLWAIDMLMVARHRRGAAAAQLAIAALTGSQILLGYPQYVWFSLFAEAGYATVAAAVGRGDSGAGEHVIEARIANERRVLVRRRGSVAVVWELLAAGWPLVTAKLCGLLLGGIQWLPTLNALTHSVRRVTDAAFSNLGSLHPLNLVQLVAPYLFTHRVAGENTHELGLYMGAVPLMLIAWLFVDRKHLGKLRPVALFAALLSFTALLMALGEYGPVYRLQRFLPIVGGFRFPCRYLVLFHLGAAILSAAGLALVLQRRPRCDRRAFRELGLLLALVTASIVAALVGLVFRNHPYVSSTAAVLAGPVLIGAAAWITVLCVRGVRWAPIALVLFAAADLGFYGMSYSAYPHVEKLNEVAARTVTPPVASSERVLADTVQADEPGLRTGNQMTLAGWHRADGYAGLEPVRRLDYRQVDSLRVAGVRWVKQNESTARICGLRRYGNGWCEVPETLPRVRMVTRARPSEDPACDMVKLAVESTALVEHPLLLPCGSAGVATVIEERPGRFRIRVSCGTTQLLVVSESFHPGWQAKIDGRPQPVWRTNGDFLGCTVEPGTHDVVLEFHPRSLRIGQILSCLGLVFAMSCFLGRLRRWPLLKNRARIT